MSVHVISIAASGTTTLRRCPELSERLGDARARAFTLDRVVRRHIVHSEYDVARGALEVLRRLAPEVDSPALQADVAFQRGLLDLRAGEHDTAEKGLLRVYCARGRDGRSLREPGLQPDAAGVGGARLRQLASGLPRRRRGAGGEGSRRRGARAREPRGLGRPGHLDRAGSVHRRRRPGERRAGTLPRPGGGHRPPRPQPRDHLVWGPADARSRRRRWRPRSTSARPGPRVPGDDDVDVLHPRGAGGRVARSTSSDSSTPASPSCCLAPLRAGTATRPRP